jgi:hypothetical protein
MAAGFFVLMLVALVPAVRSGDLQAPDGGQTPHTGS